MTNDAKYKFLILNVVAVSRTRAATQPAANLQMPEALDPSRRRWHARMSEMPEAQQEALRAKAEQRVRDIEQRQARRQALREERKEQRDARQAQRSAKFDALKETDPEAYQAYIESRETLRQQIVQQR